MATIDVPGCRSRRCLASPAPPPAPTDRKVGELSIQSEYVVGNMDTHGDMASAEAVRKDGV
jgi:hypothetical protein